MKITFLGTGSADWKKELHGARADFRRQSALLIDDCLLIDLGPAVPDALAAFGKDMRNIKYVLNTHTHSDHFNADTLSALTAAGATLCRLSVGEEQVIGRYRVRALPANHVPGKNTVHFLISDGEKSLFYGLDGAWLMYEEFHALLAAKPDLAVLDATLGDCPGNYRIFEHNDLSMVLSIKEALAPATDRFFITHISCQLNYPHDELTKRMAPHGIEVAYDGLEIEL